MEKEAFIELIKDHQKLIYKICNTYCPNPEERQDLEQEILLQLWKAMQRFDGSVRPSTWIYRVALNTAISYYRKDRKYKGKKIPIDASIITLPAEGVDAVKNEQVTLLHQFINELAPANKALLLLLLSLNRVLKIHKMDYYNSSVLTLQKQLYDLQYTRYRFGRLELVLNILAAVLMWPIVLYTGFEMEVYENPWVLGIALLVVAVIAVPIVIPLERSYRNRLKNAEQLLKEIEALERS